MNSKDQRGAIQTSVIVAAFTTVLFVASLIVSVIMYAGKADLQNNIDDKVAVGVAQEAKAIEAKKDAELLEKEKSPVKTYIGPANLGSVSFTYPKTYSAYIIESSTTSSGTPLEGFLHPNVVPKDDKSVSFALRFELSNTAYDAQVKTFDSALKSGKVSIQPFRSAKVPEVLGVRINGEIITGKQGSMIIVSVRDKTLRIWTESNDTVPDFDTYIVPSLSFAP